MLKGKCILLFFIGLSLFSLPATSQHFYDSAGHMLAYQKGVILYNSLDKPIGKIWPGGFRDTAGFLVVTQNGNRFNYSNDVTKFKYWDSTSYTSVYKEGTDIFDWPGRHNIGQIVAYNIYDGAGNKLGYTDKEIPEGEAIIFYFFLIPIYAGK